MVDLCEHEWERNYNIAGFTEIFFFFKKVGLFIYNDQFYKLEVIYSDEIMTSKNIVRWMEKMLSKEGIMKHEYSNVITHTFLGNCTTSWVEYALLRLSSFQERENLRLPSFIIIRESFYFFLKNLFHFTYSLQRLILLLLVEPKVWCLNLIQNRIDLILGWRFLAQECFKKHFGLLTKKKFDSKEKILIYQNDKYGQSFRQEFRNWLIRVENGYLRSYITGWVKCKSQTTAEIL